MKIKIEDQKSRVKLRDLPPNKIAVSEESKFVYLGCDDTLIVCLGSTVGESGSPYCVSRTDIDEIIVATIIDGPVTLQAD